MQAAKPKVGFIGTGNMGRPLIERLLNAGYEVQVHDIDPARAGPVIELGAVWKDTPALCAYTCQIVVTCLPLPHHVLENMTGEHGALAGMAEGTVWIDTSTTDYHNTRHIAELAWQKNIFSLEAPVSNLSHMGVDFANVCFYIGGDERGYRLSQTTLDTMGRKSFYVGEIGAGQSVKLLTNLLFYTATVVWAELLVMARAHDIPLHWLWDYVKVSRGNCFVSNQLTPFIFDASYDHSCTLEITVKDTSLTEALADELGVAMPLGRIVAQRYHQAGTLFDSQDNHVKVVALSERENDLSLTLPDFHAPSPYGANRDYCHSGEVIEDPMGRITPALTPMFHSGLVFTDNSKIKLASHLVEFLACINKVILDEAWQIGRAIGLADALIEQVVNWSCGPSWVAEHLDSYEPCLDQYRSGWRAPAGAATARHRANFSPVDSGLSLPCPRSRAGIATGSGRTMKITSIKVYQLDIPLKNKYSLSGGRLHYDSLDSTIVLVFTDSGLVGVGESCPWGATYLPAYAKGVRAGIEELAPHLLGENPLHLDQINARMDVMLPGHPYVKAAIDLACWDILGKHCQLPVYALLGGRFQASIALQSSIPTDDTEQMATHLALARSEGYRTHSCKVGIGVEEDVGQIRRLLDQRLPGEVITFDVNRAWTVSEAVAVMNSVEDPTVCFEQPCESLEQCRAVRELTRNPIILDESIVTLGDLVQGQRQNIAQLIGLKIGRVGGLTKARQLRDFCIYHGIRMNIEDVGGTQVSDSAVMHLAASTPGRLHRASWNCCRHHEMRVAEVDFEISQGRAYLRDRPGLGLTLDSRQFEHPVAQYG